MLFLAVHPTARLLYRCLSFHKFPSDAALRRNRARNICREFGLLTVPHVCVLSILLPYRTTYQVEKECARPRRQVILKSNAIPTCAVGCTAGNMQHSGVAYLQSVEKCIKYISGYQGVRDSYLMWGAISHRLFKVAPTKEKGGTEEKSKKIK